jgi:rapamycin-insensitive companion of mTOR
LYFLCIYESFLASTGSLSTAGNNNQNNNLPPQPPSHIPSSAPLDTQKRLSLSMDQSDRNSLVNFVENIPEATIVKNSADDFDPIYNLLDNYTALLCCAFLHMDLVSSLFVLGVEGNATISAKSRSLMVTFMNIVSCVLPESACADLLTNPSLIEIAVTVGNHKIMNKSHRSSQLLIELAEAFSIMSPTNRQTSGLHVSNLSTLKAQENRQRSASATSGRSVGNASMSGNQSNFQPLNIKTVYQLAEEIKISSFSSISTDGRKGEDQARPGSPHIHQLYSVDTLLSLRGSLTPLIDRTDFNRQIEQSRVIGKEGKEPFKWDWITISDMLEYSFSNPDRLSEALRTKWIRRLSGFFRCTVDEKGYFANLEWDPTNLQYLECACNLYSVLLRDEQGKSFLKEDRRGVIFNQIALELEQLIRVVEPSYGQQSLNLLVHAGAMNSTIPSSKYVFRLFGCTSTMAREFFTLLGRIVRHPGSKRLLDETKIFLFLSKMGQHRQLDYLSRVAVTALSFHDGGMLSHHLVQYWCVQGCSSHLRQYVYSVLRCLAQTLSTNDPCYWCVDSIVTQIIRDESSSDVLYRILGELILSKSNLRIVVGKNPRRIVTEPAAQVALIRFASIPEGISFLNDTAWLDNALHQWSVNQVMSKSKDYVLQVEERIAISLSRPQSIVKDPFIFNQIVQPIPIQAPEVVQQVLARQGMLGSMMASSSSSSSSSFSAANEIDHGSKNIHANRRYNPNASLVQDLRGFLRVPWNIELKFSSPEVHGNTANSATGQGDYLRMDTFLDISDYRSSLSYEITSDTNRIFKVKGIVLDGRNQPTGQAILPTTVIHSTLMAGICPITKAGDIQNLNDAARTRRRSSADSSMMNNGSNAGNRTGGASGNSNQGTTRGSITGNIGLIGNPLDGGLETDTPISLGIEQYFEWITCQPGHRQGHMTELEDGRYAVTLPGEPIVFIFSRRVPGASFTAASGAVSGGVGRQTRTGSMMKDSEALFEMNRANRTDTSRAGSLLFLMEVHYYFRLKTGMVRNSHL